MTYPRQISKAVLSLILSSRQGDDVVVARLDLKELLGGEREALPGADEPREALIVRVHRPGREQVSVGVQNEG